MKYKISVIIPCYNSENTIERTIKSIISQSIGFENIQLILYDDGSTDDTKKYFLKYSKKYDNIYPIFSAENYGASKGRNECLKKVLAEFIMFIDSDDEYDKDICKRLYDEITTNSYDLVTCNYKDIDNIHNHVIRFDYLAEKSSINNENKVVFNSKNAFYFNNSVVWNSIFKKDIVLKNNIQFPDASISEDTYFTLHYKAHCSSICYLKNYTGIYRYVYEDSLSNSFNYNNLISIHEIQVRILNELNCYELDFAYIFRGYIKASLIRLYITNLLNCDKNKIKNFLKKLHEFENKINFNYSLGIILNILNYLILNEKYELSIIYLKIIRNIFKSKTLRKIYRILIK